MRAGDGLGCVQVIGAALVIASLLLADGVILAAYLKPEAVRVYCGGP